LPELTTEDAVEIEAKFNVPDREVLGRLQALDRLAGFDLGPGRVKHVHDTYLDTLDRRILSNGYACRLRMQGDERLVTLKSLGGAHGAIHRREELEVVVPTMLAPAQWPTSPARERVLQLIGELPLTPLLELHQTRLVRDVVRSAGLVAELSLDEVRVVIGGREHTYLEAEAELKQDGTEDDLLRLAQCLRDDWRLLPEPRSKFERALSLPVA
jgi:triphosphatase